VGEGLLYMGDTIGRVRDLRFDSAAAGLRMIFDASEAKPRKTQGAQRGVLGGDCRQGPACAAGMQAMERWARDWIFPAAAGLDVCEERRLRSVNAEILPPGWRAKSANAAGATGRWKKSSRPDSSTLTPERGAWWPMAAVRTGLRRRSSGAGTVRAIRAIVFNGPIWPPAQHGEGGGWRARALLRRWNVHPTFSQNRRLIENVSPRRVRPAFGDARFYPIWRECLAPR